MPPKSRTALFLGAGASAPLGYPMTSGILPEIADRLASGAFENDELSTKGKTLHEYLLRAFPGMATGAMKDAARSLPVTDILSLLDYCIGAGETLADRDDLTVQEARSLLERAILEVLLRPNEDRKAMSVRLVSGWLKSQAKEGVDVSTITTNYDVGIDLHLFKELFDSWDEQYTLVDFGFSWRTVDTGEIVAPARDAILRLYKLHGSLNWLRCDLCGFIYVNFSGAIAALADEDVGPAGTCHCGCRPLRAVLVTPSYVRNVRERNLLSCWQHAGEKLRQADRWVFVGYSLPAEDVAIRSMILRARLGRTRGTAEPRVDVVQLGSDAETERRYRLLFPSCRYTRDGFGKFLEGSASWT